ncbi:GPI transamidase subunit PIG-U [Artemisia annua]|uniref:GPI transamidase subunit PIG-U n=1 Tax=Artemisia annua TaxID=35608 RepID=A0A2U1KJ64_ARTAN|nr:GPI transamidase subunit PIG-U [Artemisia annua]
MTKPSPETTTAKTKHQPWFWTSALASVLLRLVLIVYFPNTLNFSSRPEVSTPVTSLRRLAEGYWLKQSSMSPYAGSMYHGSPLLLSILGPLTVNRGEGQPSNLLCGKIPILSLISFACEVKIILKIRKEDVGTDGK